MFKITFKKNRILKFQYIKLLIVLISLSAYILTSCKNVGSNYIYSPNCDDGYYILTPVSTKKPTINSPKIFGVRPNNPFNYCIAASGEKPMVFCAKNLPIGLKLDSISGIISGIISSPEHKNYTVNITAQNRFGKANKQLKIVVGNKIGLTPPLGWNSWNAWGSSVNQNKVLSTANAIKNKGLIDYGWTYVNIDDTWQGQRGGKYNAIQPDSTKFRDIKTMIDSIHSLGLKVGIYSSPWVTTYGGRVGGSSDYENGFWSINTHAGTKENKQAHFYIGQYKFDTNDVKQWADWGIDYIKYDWSKTEGVESIVRMANALRECGRDIFFSLSNTGLKSQHETYMIHANSWRTTEDLKDRWDEDGFLLSIIDVWDSHLNYLDSAGYGESGHFPDADMLVIGPVIEKNFDEEPRPSRLTPDQQYSHISLWTLWGSPLLIGAPVEKMSDFDISLLKNSEVIGIHQDPLGYVGRTISKNNNIFIVKKELEENNIAVGLFNRNADTAIATVNWSQLNINGRKKVRDVWRQTDIGYFKENFAAKLRPHGVVLLKISK